LAKCHIEFIFPLQHQPGKSADDPEKSGWIFPFPIGGTDPSRSGSTYEDRPARIDL